MFMRKKRSLDNEALEKLRDAKTDLDLERLGDVGKIVSDNIDDIPLRLEKLINNHPAYTRDIFAEYIDVKTHFNKTYKESLAKAIELGDKKKIHLISTRVAELYVPKDLGPIRRFFEKQALVYAFKSFVKDYELGTSKIN